MCVKKNLAQTNVSAVLLDNNQKMKQNGYVLK